MLVDEFVIILDNGSRIYQAGDKLSGKLVVKLSNVQDVKGIQVRFYGEARTTWQKATMTKDLYTFTAFSDESFFDEVKQLYGDETHIIGMHRGETIFPFSFQIPRRSFIDSCHFDDGFVEYAVEAEINLVTAQTEFKTEKVVVSLHTPLDLDAVANASDPVEVSEKYSLGCCCRPCQLTMSMSQLGHCRGDAVPLFVSVDTRTPIEHVTVSLIQFWILSGSRKDSKHSGPEPFNTHEVQVDQYTFPDFPKGKTDKRIVSFKLPYTITPTCFNGACKIFAMEYYLHLHGIAAKACGQTQQINIRVPVVIGTSPLTSNESKFSFTTPSYSESGGLA